MATQNIEFSQAMSDFATMFPEFDSDVIEAVLRANSGAVDATIDALLQMSTDNHNEKLRNELDQTTEGGTKLQHPDLLLSKTNSTTTTTTTKTATSEMNGAKGKTLSQSQSTTNKRWNPPILGPLPASFLRIAPTQYEMNLDDEQFAEMLQNEEFMNELRWNKVSHSCV